MKLIKPSFEILEQGPTISDMYKHITKCGYTCYKTEKEITDESAEAFVNRMKDSKHFAMLEHGTVTLKVKKKSYEVSSSIKGVVTFLISQHLWTRWFTMPSPDKEWYIYIVTNYRVIVENQLEDFMKQYWTEDKNLISLRPCVRIVTDNGVGRELTRHRVFSWAQESTRYCNYSVDRFGNELTFVEPYWYNDAEEVVKSDFDSALKYIEDTYLTMIDHQYSAQQARAILPLCLKTELIMTGFRNDWEHFYDLRALDKTGAAHPDMKAIAVPMLEEFKNRNYIAKDYH